MARTLFFQLTAAQRLREVFREGYSCDAARGTAAGITVGIIAIPLANGAAIAGVLARMGCYTASLAG